MTMGQSVTLGGLPLMIDGQDAVSVDGYSFRVAGDEANLGNAQSVTSVLLSMLANGSVVSRDRSDNRTQSFVVEVVARENDGLALARGEAALRAVCCKPVELVWQPPQAGAPPAVFDVVNSDLELLYSDVDEMELFRGYKITMSSLPWARSENLTTTPAIAPGTGSTVTINAADNISGWEAPYDGTSTVTDLGTALRVTASDGNTEPSSYLKAALMMPDVAADAFDAYPFLVVEWRTDNLRPDGEFNLLYTITPSSPGFVGTRPKVAEFAIDDDWIRTYFRMSPGEYTSLTFEAGKFWNYGGGYNLDVRDVSKTDTPPAVGTRRQLVSRIVARGSEETQGSIDVQHPTTDLGSVVVYTRPQGPEPYTPALSPYWAYGAAWGPDSSLLSGKTFPCDATGPGFSLPAFAVPPGEYALVVRMRNYTDSNMIPLGHHQTIGSVGAGGIVEVTADVPVNVQIPQDVWTIVNLGAINLPNTRVGPNSPVALYITRLSGAQSLAIDEVWIFKMDGSLTIVDPVGDPYAAGMNRQRLRIIAPSLDERSGAIFASDTTDFLQAVSVSRICKSRQHHRLQPGDNMIFAAATGATDVAVSATHYNRWSTFPGED